MFRLSCEAAGNVRERGVRFDDFGVAKLLQGTDVARVQLFKPLASESKSTEVIFNGVEEGRRICS